MGHCDDNDKDRKIGQLWERKFCEIASEFGYLFTPLQINHGVSIQAFSKNGKKWNRFTLPDVVIWTFPGQHHEIKHKGPTPAGWFGLERYRFDALLAFAEKTRQDVMYTIHNHALTGGRDVLDNDIDHWVTANIHLLNGTWAHLQENGTSWVNGVKKTKVPIYYWDINLWIPLRLYWELWDDKFKDAA
jgi:hypothetical protein